MKHIQTLLIGAAALSIIGGLELLVLSHKYLWLPALGIFVFAISYGFGKCLTELLIPSVKEWLRRKRGDPE